MNFWPFQGLIDLIGYSGKCLFWKDHFWSFHKHQWAQRTQTSKDLPNCRLNCFRIWWTRILLMAPYCVWNLPQINIFYLLQARWITVCSNILRLYVQTAKPSQKLIKLVKYIVLVYCPILFDIKWKPEATNGKTEFMYNFIQLYFS